MLPDARWRPYAATGMLLACAASMNLATGNRLWMGYTVFGASLLLIAIGLARLKGWFIPPRPAWLLGAMAALHYGGGSLSGLHQVGGANGLYYAFPWWDNLVHIVGSTAVGLASAMAVHAVLPGRRWAAFALAACVATTFGVLVELYEFSQFAWFGTVDQGYYTNTMVDLYNNLVGAMLGAWLFARDPDGMMARDMPPTPAAAQDGSDAPPASAAE